ncbi:polysaccharide biosynthesis tyrosine autokinase [Sphingomonas lutea]|uniref:non-specific protein-tyrosine kinase n=1 Tax=Sphingomonas lutea TaxID=1045317 RepID=A0A7G9SG57_9SPHN|nr:polysaccharide biosynthesis tyrosine autokinase [Sphingomonas lutea]QNN66832.1 polysaccharide biosynthesis tyrosine autokinase [Sphingomonas lutea]
MNNSITVPDQGPWPIQQYLPGGASQLQPGQRVYSAANILDLNSFLRIVQHWRWLILAAVAVGVAVAIVVTLLTTPVYRSSVTLEANPPSVSVSEDDTRERERTSTNSFDFIATQAGLLASKSVAQRTAQELNLANNADFVPQDADASTRLKMATAKVHGGLRVIPPEEGQLIRFSYSDTSPQLAAMIANGIADSFINSALQRRYEASAYARNFLERQISKTRGDLEKSERALVAYAQAQGIITTAQGTDGKPASDASSLQGESLIALNRALSEATARRVAAEGAYRQSQSVGQTSDVTASTQALRQQRALLQADYQQKRTFMKPDHPEMLALQSQINELDAAISREGGQMQSGRTNSLLADYRAAQSAEQALQARVAQLKGAVLNLRGRSIQYNIYQREVDTNRSLYDALLQRYKQIGVAGGIGVAPVSVVDRGEVPGAPFKPNLLFNLLAGIAFGLLAGIAGAVGLEFINDTIKTREDIRTKLQLACLGTVPRTAAKDTFVEDLKNPTSMVSEAYSAIVAALRYSTESGMPKVLLMTSTRPAEGKSSSALAIAQNLARRERRVLLIDGDLRKPAFKSANDKVGLSKLLTTEDSVAAHVVETQHEKLWLLPSGPVPPNPADLLATGRIRKVIAEAEGMFDVIVIDGPPTLGLADSPLLSAVAGNVLFAIESGKTRTRAAIEALNRLEATGTHVLGAILTKSTEHRGGYGYKGYGYGYGYGYGQEKVRGKRTEILMIPQDSDA